MFVPPMDRADLQISAERLARNLILDYPPMLSPSTLLRTGLSKDGVTDGKWLAILFGMIRPKLTLSAPTNFASDSSASFKPSSAPSRSTLTPPTGDGRPAANHGSK